jgi:glc operon protein GlcG
MKPLAEQLVDEIATLFPLFLQDPIDAEHSKGNAVVLVIDGEGRTFGRVFGADKDSGRRCFGIASRKVAQVWRTGYATGEFEKLVYEGKLDEGAFGVIRPEFIGWQGGVPLEGPDGKLIAAAFSGFRGIKDIEIIERASASVPGLNVRRHTL